MATLPDFIPAGAHPDTEPALSARLHATLRGVPMDADADVEDLLWEAECYEAEGDNVNLTAALDLLAPLVKTPVA